MKYLCVLLFLYSLSLGCNSNSDLQNKNESNVTFENDDNENSTESEFDYIKRVIEGRNEIGLHGEKPIKFEFTKIYDNKIEGFNTLLHETNHSCSFIWDNRDQLFSKANVTTRPFKGTFAIHERPSGQGFNYTRVYVILNEPGDDEWDGQFDFFFDMSDQWGYGEGTWKSYNGKLTRKIKICYN